MKRAPQRWALGAVTDVTLQAAGAWSLPRLSFRDPPCRPPASARAPAQPAQPAQPAGPARHARPAQTCRTRLPVLPVFARIRAMKLLVLASAGDPARARIIHPRADEQSDYTGEDRAGADGCSPTRDCRRDGTIACTSCHDPERAFTKPDAVSPGVFGRRGRRNAPTVVNRAWGRAFFWDGRARRSRSRCSSRSRIRTRWI